MSYVDHEVFQAFCRFCFQKIEADSYEEVLKKVEEHEALRKNGKCQDNKK